MSNILIAGGAGFIGSHLSKRLLTEGHRVICVDNLITGSKENIKEPLSNSNFTFIEYDITTDLSTINYQLSTIDFVFHLASPASPNHHSKLSYHALPMETMIANTQGTLALLKLAEKNNARFLFASTSEVYGDPLENPQKESYRGNVSTTGPRSVYDEAKRFGETLTAYFWRDKNVNARIVRIFNTYGPLMQKGDKRMVIDFINQALRQEPITIFGDGEQTRSLCYIDDLVDGLMKMMFSDKTNKEILNLGSEEEHTVLEYAQIIKQLTNSSSEIIHSEDLPEDDPKARCPDITKAKELLEWEPHVSLEEGLQKTIEYFSSL
ncbi:MAG TPA: NAD-dependent epimerase/dehydratase family protein [Patescibacteria group bacterium]|nr:NAD-dependent epimerase/dehydratase family protein [Patescibacteria group bacterium]